MPENAIIRSYLRLTFLNIPQPEWVFTILFPISSIIIFYRVNQSKVENVAYIHNIYHIYIAIYIPIDNSIGKPVTGGIPSRRVGKDGALAFSSLEVGTSYFRNSRLADDLRSEETHVMSLYRVR